MISERSTSAHPWSPSPHAPGVTRWPPAPPNCILTPIFPRSAKDQKSLKRRDTSRLPGSCIYYFFNEAKVNSLAPPSAVLLRRTRSGRAAALPSWSVKKEGQQNFSSCFRSTSKHKKQRKICWEPAHTDTGYSFHICHDKKFTLTFLQAL